MLVRNRAGCDIHLRQLCIHQVVMAHSKSKRKAPPTPSPSSSEHQGDEYEDEEEEEENEAANEEVKEDDDVRDGDEENEEGNEDYEEDKKGDDDDFSYDEQRFDPRYLFLEDHEPHLITLAHALSDNQVQAWGGQKQFLKNKLCPKYCNLHELSCSQIFPPAHDDKVSLQRALLMFSTISGASIDLASLMLIAILVRVPQTYVPNSLPFAGPIMRLLEESHVPIDAHLQIVRPLAMISGSTTTRSEIQAQHQPTPTEPPPPARPLVVPTIYANIKALDTCLSSTTATSSGPSCSTN